MKNFKVKAKLLTGFLIVTALAIIVGGVGVFNMKNIDNSYSDAIDLHGKSLEKAALALAAIHSVRAEIRLAVIYIGSPDKVDAQEKLVQAACDKFDTNAEDLGKFVVDPDQKKSFDDAMDAFHNKAEPALKQALADIRAGKTADEVMAYLLDNVNPSVSLAATNMENITTAKAQQLNTTSTESTNLADLSIIIMIAVSVAVAAVSVVLALYISGLIGKPLVPLTSFVENAGNSGDITITPTDTENIGKYASRKDEIGRLYSGMQSFIGLVTGYSESLGKIADNDLTLDIKPLSERDTLGLSMKKMTDNLNSMFSEINSATSQVAIGSKQVADGSQTLAQGSTEQAASVEQLSSSISEIARKTKENADMASKAAELANNIMHNAEKGSAQMSEMIAAVKEINTASQSISKVIKVIDDIAFQTNILALNAAVEAARAGQHGKGFAVVAEEVRNLASKSAEAAKDTGNLIANSMEKAELGTRIAGETSASLAEIVQGINESNELVSEIAQSSMEQSSGIAQINIGIDQVTQVIQQNSATAEESAAASEEMSSQSAVLEELIEQFKLKDDGHRNLSYAAESKRDRPKQKQFGIPEKSTYAPQSGGDFGKY